MPTILCAMPERTYRRMMTPVLENQLHALGNVVHCRDAASLTDEEYGRFWAEADAAVTGWGVRPPTPAMLDRATRLRVISHTAGTVRMFPRYALEKGITITSARAAIARSVGEFCLMNTFLLLRRSLYHLDSGTARKDFYASDGTAPNSETLFGKTVGLIGFGYAGRHFRKLLAPFGCRVLVYDPYLSATDAEKEQVEQTDLPTLLQSSKVVSLHAPDLPETKGMIGKAEFDLLSNGSVFLNAARGRLVDTDAMTASLQTGRFFAALDVTDPEPLPPDHPLRFLPNVLFTPHVAGPTEDELPELTGMALTDLARFLHGESPLYPVSLSAYDLMSF